MNIEWAKLFSKITNKVEGWIEHFFAMLPNLGMAIIVLVLFVVAARLIRNLGERLIRRMVDHNTALVNLFSRIIFLGVISIGLFTALDILNLDKAVTSLLAGVGVVGLALGFAFQDIAANFVSGTILAFKRPFKEGDVVEIDGMLGVMVYSNLRVTVFHTFQGQEVYIPNKQLIQAKVTNYSVTRERRIDLPLGISYEDDLEHAQQVATKAIENLPGVKTEKNVLVTFEEFGNSSINLMVRFWMQNPDEFLTLRSQAIIAIKKAFDQEGITIPFPITTLDLGHESLHKLSEVQFNLAKKEESRNGIEKNK